MTGGRLAAKCLTAQMFWLIKISWTRKRPKAEHRQVDTQGPDGLQVLP